MKIHAKLLSVSLLLRTLSLHPMLLDSNFDASKLEKAEEQDQKHKKSLSTTSSELVELNITQYPLKDLINDFAHKLNINVLYPETESITTTITFNAGKKITTTEAWNFVLMFIEQAGFTLLLRGTGTYVLMANSKSYREPLPLYIGVDFNQLPDTMQRIRYIYYFNNIQVATQQAMLSGILNDILPAQDIASQLMFDATANSMILSTRTDLIKTVMQIISVLDETGFQQAVELLKLEYASAVDVALLFKNILAGGDPAKKPSGFVSLATGARAKYFSDNVRVENLDPNNVRKLNTVVIMGKMHDIEEIKKFIKKYLDVPQESGSSFFHIVELQWAQASALVTTLSALIQGGTTPAGQSTGAVTTDLGFDPAIKVVSETIKQGPTPAAAAATAAAGGANPTNPLANTIQRGANKLIIACSTREWQRLEGLIKQLDVPQKQVVIEALVVDLNLQFIRKLGAQLRTKGLTTSIFPKNMQAQAGLLINNVIAPMNSATNTAGNPDYYSLVGDLSDILNPDWNPSPAGGGLATPNVSTTITSTTPGTAPSGFTGSTVCMLNGGKAATNGVWAFFQLLSQHISSKIFTRPVLLVSNNQSANVSHSVNKNLIGSVTAGVNPTVAYQQVQAPVSITFTPLISDNDTVNLAMNIQLTTYAVPSDASSGDQIIRSLQTNITMKSGDVCLCGGLTTEQTSVTKSSVPFLENIPIIGNFFASRSKASSKTQLFILVRCTVCSPKVGGSLSKITQSATNFITDQLADTENDFANLKDPITRWFFNSDRDETSSEFVIDKINDMQKNAYDSLNTIFNASHSGQAEKKPDHKKDNIKIAWFSDAKSEHDFTIHAGTKPDSDMDKISALLKDMQNPFSSYTQV